MLVHERGILRPLLVQRLEQGGFAGAARADEGDMLTGANVQRDVAQGHLIAIGNVGPVEFKHANLLLQNADLAGRVQNGLVH
jgi:hypothetical protein